MSDACEIRSLLEERPELEPAVEAVLEPAEPWTFDDVDVDSDASGELVSHGVVESDRDGYRVVDKTAVETTLDEPDRPTDINARRVG